MKKEKDHPIIEIMDQKEFERRVKELTAKIKEEARINRLLKGKLIQPKRKEA